MMPCTAKQIDSRRLFVSFRQGPPWNGVQYTCNRFANIISLNSHAKQSMSRKGNCWDNSVAESFFKTIKYEELNHHQFESYEQLSQCIESYIWWYNTKRIHSSLDYETPLEREIKIRTKNTKRAA